MHLCQICVFYFNVISFYDHIWIRRIGTSICTYVCWSSYPSYRSWSDPIHPILSYPILSYPIHLKSLIWQRQSQGAPAQDPTTPDGFCGCPMWLVDALIGYIICLYIRTQYIMLKKILLRFNMAYISIFVRDTTLLWLKIPLSLICLVANIIL